MQHTKRTATECSYTLQYFTRTVSLYTKNRRYSIISSCSGFSADSPSFCYHDKSSFRSHPSRVDVQWTMALLVTTFHHQSSACPWGSRFLAFLRLSGECII
jgi:hypothetical protein